MGIRTRFNPMGGRITVDGPKDIVVLDNRTSTTNITGSIALKSGVYEIVMVAGGGGGSRTYNTATTSYQQAGGGEGGAVGITVYLLAGTYAYQCGGYGARKENTDHSGSGSTGGQTYVSLNGNNIARAQGGTGGQTHITSTTTSNWHGGSGGGYGVYTGDWTVLSSYGASGHDGNRKGSDGSPDLYTTVCSALATNGYSTGDYQLYGRNGRYYTNAIGGYLRITYLRKTI